MAENTMLKEALQAIADGQRVRARDLLTRLLRSDQNNAEYWLWMSSVVDTVAERVYCLETVLRIEPHNKTAQRGLIVLGGTQSWGRCSSCRTCPSQMDRRTGRSTTSPQRIGENLC